MTQKTTVPKRGSEYYAEIGRIGGAKLRDQRGSEYYSRLGMKGGRAKARKERLAREANEQGQNN